MGRSSLKPATWSTNMLVLFELKFDVLTYLFYVSPMGFD